MKIITLLMMCCGALVLVGETRAQVALPENTGSIEFFRGREVAARQVLVRFRPGTTLSRIGQAKIAVDAGAERGVGGGDLRLLHSRSKNVEQLIAELSARPDVLYAEPNYVRRIDAVPNDPNFTQLYALRDGTGGIGAVSAWDVTKGSRTAAVVGILDTGVDYNHPDLAANMWSAPAAFTVNIGGRSITCPQGSHGYNAIARTCNPADDHYHGTHVAGTIGATGNNGTGVTGVNWTASLMALKFIAANGEGTDADAIDAIEFAIQVKAAFAASGGANVRVLNNSYGGPDFSQAFLDQISRARDHGLLFVAAAGNSGNNNDIAPFYPASYNVQNIISVAATDSGDGLASFSNYGAGSTHLGAPGVNILSTVPGSGYSYASGTSMATPHVAGAAALLLSRCALDTNNLKATLLGNTDSVSALAGRVISGGRLNVNRALRACDAPAPPPPSGGSTAYLSDLTPSYTASGWGPVERDRSNGESAGGDGRTLTLNGTTYTKGLGVHSYSEVRYTLGGRYASFLADVGVDDEVGARGSVVFQVWADGSKLHESGRLTGASTTQRLTVDVSGRNELILIVTDAGDGFAYDHADWADARLTTATTTTPPPSDWTRCASENQNCAFTGTRQVRYGAGGTYAYGTFTGGVQCSNSIFGDPLYGVLKSCDYGPLLSSTPPPPPPPSSWTYCASENQNCAFTGTRQVRYGAGGTYAYGTFTNGVQCSNSVFGDPVYGVVKTCEIGP